MAELVLRPRHRHQAQFTVEVRHINRNLRDAARAHFHKAGEQRDGFRRHNGERTPTEAVAALAQ